MAINYNFGQIFAQALANMQQAAADEQRFTLQQEMQRKQYDLDKNQFDFSQRQYDEGVKRGQNQEYVRNMYFEDPANVPEWAKPYLRQTNKSIFGENLQPNQKYYIPTTEYQSAQEHSFNVGKEINAMTGKYRQIPINQLKLESDGNYYFYTPDGQKVLANLGSEIESQLGPAYTPMYDTEREKLWYIPETYGELTDKQLFRNKEFEQSKTLEGMRHQNAIKELKAKQEMTPMRWKLIDKDTGRIVNTGTTTYGDLNKPGFWGTQKRGDNLKFVIADETGDAEVQDIVKGGQIKLGNELAKLQNEQRTIENRTVNSLDKWLGITPEEKLNNIRNTKDRMSWAVKSGLATDNAIQKINDSDRYVKIKDRISKLKVQLQMSSGAIDDYLNTLRTGE